MAQNEKLNFWLSDGSYDSKIPFDCFTAASNGDLFFFTKYMVGATENFSAVNKSGWTPIMYACAKGHTLLVSYLMMCGVKTASTAKSRVTPLMLAITSGDLPTVQCVFNPADLENRDYRLWTPLFYAVFFLQEKCVQFLLSKGANVNIADFQNETPLMIAIKSGSESMVKLLLQTANNLDVISFKNESAIMLAKESKSPKIREMVLNHKEIVKKPEEQNLQTDSVTPQKKFLKLNSEHFPNHSPSLVKSPKSRSFLGLKMSKSFSYSPNSSAKVGQSRSVSSNQFSPDYGKMSLWKMCLNASPVASGGDYDVEMLLTSLGLEKYWPIFRDEEVDFETLLTFNEENLKEALRSKDENPVSDYAPQDVPQKGRIAEQGSSRSHKYRNSISLVHISPKSTSESSRTDENGNALNLSSLSARGSTLKKNHKRKLTEKNVVLSVSENIAGYRGNDKLEDLLNFIENDDYNKSKNLKKTLTKGKKHEKKRQNIQKSSSLEEISQRNIEDLTESSEGQKNGRKTKIMSTDETGLRERRSWGDQVYVRSERQNNLAVEQADENNSDSDFQMVTKKQRKRKVNDANAKRIRNHRSMKRSPRRKSTSSVPPSERSGDSDLDSIHSLPVGGAPITSYADIAAGNSNFFNSKGIREMSTFNKKESSQRKSASAKNNEIQEWCDSVSQHMENNIKNINNNSNNNTSNINKNNSPNNHINNNNDSNYIYDINNINNNTNNSISYLKNFSRQDDRKQQNLDVDQNGICDTNVRKLRDLVIVDKSIVDSEVTKSNKVVEPPLKNEFKKVASNCDLNQCKNVDNRNIEVKKNWNKKNFSREEFPSLPIKSDISNYPKAREISDGSSMAKTKQYSSLSDADKQSEESKLEGSTTKSEKKSTNDEDVQHRRSNRSKSVGPNARPAVILLHDERTQDAGVREITFGFEVNEQLLTSDNSGQLYDEESEPIVNASNSKVSVKIGSNDGNGEKKNCENIVADGTANDANGGIVYNDIIENRKALKNPSKSTFEEITNSTVQELFKRHEIASKIIPHDSNANRTTSATALANKYVPPSSPIDFNHDKIVTFVGTAWEDVIRTGKIQYYSGEK